MSAPTPSADQGPADDDRDRLSRAGDWPMLAPLGMTCSKVGHDTITLHVAADPFVPNPNGSVNGGVLTAMLEQAMALLGVRVCEPGSTVSTSSVHVQFYRPPRVPLTLEVALLPGGRRVKFVQVTVTGDDGLPCAGAQGTLVVADDPGRTEPASPGPRREHIETPAGWSTMLPAGTSPGSHPLPPSWSAPEQEWVNWANASPTYAALHLRCHRLDRTTAEFSLERSVLPLSADGTVRPCLLMIAADIAAGALAGRAGPERKMSATGSLFAQPLHPTVLPVTLEATFVPGQGRAQAVRVEISAGSTTVMSVNTTMIVGAGARY